MITYKGESPAKKILRYRYWCEVRDLLKERFFSGKHLVLASQEGGDLSTLIWLGVDPTNIIAIDRNRAALAAVKKKYHEHGVTFVHGDVFDFKAPKRKKAKAKSTNIVSAFFDFCSPTSVDLMNRVVRWSRSNLSTDSVVGVAVLRGRERDQAFKVYLNSFRDQSSRGEGALPFDQWAKKLPRADVLETMLFIQAIEEGFLLFPEWSAAYQSRTRDSNGVPMLVTLMRVWKPMTPKRKGILVRKFVKEMNVDLENGTISGGRRENLTKVDDEVLRDTALRSCDTEETSAVAGLLNIPTQRLAAWKAHRTMGTYD